MMNFEQSEKQIADIQKWYRQEIYRVANNIGGIGSLSKDFGYTEKYLYRLLKRNSFSALRRIVKKIYGVANLNAERTDEGIQSNRQ